MNTVDTTAFTTLMRSRSMIIPSIISITMVLRISGIMVKHIRFTEAM